MTFPSAPRHISAGTPTRSFSHRHTPAYHTSAALPALMYATEAPVACFPQNFCFARSLGESLIQHLQTDWHRLCRLYFLKKFLCLARKAWGRRAAARKNVRVSLAFGTEIFAKISVFFTRSGAFLFFGDVFVLLEKNTGKLQKELEKKASISYNI